MTQLEEATEHVKYFAVLGSDVFGEIIRSLDEVVGRAQNGPPDGEADGTIDYDDWTTLRDLVSGLLQVRKSLFRFGVEVQDLPNGDGG